MTAQGRDAGLQRERTELAWRRTLLALAAGSLIAMRVLLDGFGGAAIVVGAAGLTVAAALSVAAARRRPGERRSDGRLLAVTASACVVGALVGVADLAVRIAG